MQRRDVLGKVATAGAIVTGAASVASASGGDDELYLVTQEGGQQAITPLSEVDREVEIQDHCHEYCCEDCGNNPCDNCVCEDYCHI